VRFVAPGPAIAEHTPGRPLTRAKASAMIAPARSSRTVIRANLGAVVFRVKGLGRIDAGRCASRHKPARCHTAREHQ
jgi:hypothetical protein